MKYLPTAILVSSLCAASVLKAATIVVDPAFGNPLGPQTFDTISNAINFPGVVDGDEIKIVGGVYRETIVLNKRVSLIGNPQEEIIIDAGFVASTVGITIEASGLPGDPIVIQNVRMAGLDEAVVFNDSAATPVENVTLSQLDVSECDYGVYIDPAETVSGITITESSFNTIAESAIYVPHTIGSGATVDDLEVNTSSFEDCIDFGIYMERGSNVNISTSTFNNCGQVETYGAGISVHLRDGNYSGYEIISNTITNCGSTQEGAAGLVIRARDDGPFVGNIALLDDVEIRSNVFFDLHNAVQLGQENTQNQSPTTVLIRRNGFEPITGVDVDIDCQPDIDRDIPIEWDILSGADPLTTDYDFGSIAAAIPFLGTTDSDIINADGTFVGNYTFTNNIRIFGSGVGTTTLTAASGVVITFDGDFESKNYRTIIEGLTIDNSGGATTGLFMNSDVRNFQMNDVVMDGFADEAIDFANTFRFEDISFSSSTFSNSGVGWRLGNASDLSNRRNLRFDVNLRATDCTFDTNGTGILFADDQNTGAAIADSMLFDTCTFIGNGGSGLGNAVRIIATSDVASYVDEITFQNCTFTNNTAPVPAELGHVYTVSYGGTIERLRFIDCSFTGPGQGISSGALIYENATGGANTIANPIVVNSSFETLDTAIEVINITDTLLDNGGQPLTLGAGVTQGLNPRYELIALQGEPAPLTGYNYRIFNDAAINNNGDVLYLIKTSTDDRVTNRVLYELEGSTLSLVAQSGFADASDAFNYQFMQRFIKLADNGENYFYNRTRSRNNGIYYSVGGVTELAEASRFEDTKSTFLKNSFSNLGNVISRIVLLDEPRESNVAITYHSGGTRNIALQEGNLLGSEAFSFTRVSDDPLISTDGVNEVAYLPVVLTGTGVDSSTNNALVTFDPSNPLDLDVVAREGTPIVGSNGTLGTMRRSKSSINASGEYVQVVSLSRSAGFVDSANNEVVITNISGSMEGIIQEGNVMPGGGFLDRVLDVFINDDSVVVFFASLDGVVSTLDKAVFKYTVAGGLERLVGEGDAAPDTGGDSFRTVRRVSINSNGAAGQLMLNAKTNGINRENEGIWLYDLDTNTGSRRLAKDELFSLDGDDGYLRGFRIFGNSAGNDGKQRFFNDNNQVVLQLNTGGGNRSRGIYLIDLDL